MQKRHLVVMVIIAFCICAQAAVIKPDADSSNRIPEMDTRIDVTSRNYRHNRHHKSHRHHKHRKSSRGRSDTKLLSNDEINQNILSYRLSLSQMKPVTPPLSLMVEPKEDMNELAKEAVEIDKTSHQGPSRDKRSLGDYLHTPVCESVSEWVEKTEGQDMWGNTVEVLQEIDIGGAMVNQYFYETHCKQEKCACVGIDTDKYFSVCQNKHVWAYAKVRTSFYEEGWTLIKIRGSCNCALFTRRSQKMDLMDLIQAAAAGK